MPFVSPLINLISVKFPKDKELYTRGVLPLLKPDDSFSYEELVCRLQKDICAWWVINEGKVVGWCSAGNSPYIAGAIHLYGFCIWPEHRGRGFGTKALLARLAIYRGRAITTSIQKDSKVSLHLAEKLGFEYLNTIVPWDNFVLYQN